MDLKRVAYTVAVVGAVAAAVYFFMFREGDDRPPIIVGDGSINIYADFDPHGHGRGNWDQASGLRWTHTNTGGAPTRRFDVSILDGSGAGCDDPDAWIDSTDLRIWFTGDRSFRVWVDPAVQNPHKRLAIDFQDGTTVTQHKPYWLKVPDDALKLVKVEFAAGPTCTLGPDGEVKIYQRKK